jgi:Lysylphosphatidylglycerol synthase TM region
VGLSDAQPVRPRLVRRASLSFSCFVIAAGAAVVAWPLLREPLAEASRDAASADARLLVGAGLLFAGATACCGLAWQHAIHRAGGSLGNIDACARYGVGSLVNSFAPAHLGDVVRTGLLLEALPPGGRRRIVACFARIQAARISALVGLAVAAALPVQVASAAFVPLAVVLVACRGGASRLLTLVLLSTLTKVAGVTMVLAALGAPFPLQAAMAVVPALELAALLPLTPGNVGVASAAAAVALHASGSATGEAVQAGILIHGVETIAGISYGALSAAVCLWRVGTRRRAAAVPTPTTAQEVFRLPAPARGAGRTRIRPPSTRLSRSGGSPPARSGQHRTVTQIP